jgi:hypothetical protein
MGEAELRILILDLIATMNKVPGFSDGFGEYLDKNAPDVKEWLREPIHKYLDTEWDKRNAVFRSYEDWLKLIRDERQSL